jgi:hypothetical protein
VKRAGKGIWSDTRAARRKRAARLGLRAITREGQRRRLEKMEQQLLGGLLGELARAERSAIRRLRKQAHRVGDGEPFAETMLRAARHAERSLAEFERSARGWRQRARAAFEQVLATLRGGLADLLVNHERSYRATLLGLRSAIDCAVLTQAVAQRAGRPDLAGFCGRWLDERRRLAAECERQLAWFAFHPQFARAPATFRRAGVRAAGPAETVISRVP